MVAGMIAWFINAVWGALIINLIIRHGMWYSEDMLQKFPKHKQGLPGIWHLGVLLSPLTVSVIVGYIVGAHSHEWSWPVMLLLFCLGGAISFAIHRQYAQTPFPDPLAWKEEGITLAGWCHAHYMAVVLTIVGLLYFSSKVTLAETIGVGAVLTVHVAIGNHILLGLINERYHFSWCPEFIRKPDPWAMVGGVALVLAAFSVWATSG